MADASGGEPDHARVGGHGCGAHRAAILRDVLHGDVLARAYDAMSRPSSTHARRYRQNVNAHRVGRGPHAALRYVARSMPRWIWIAVFYHRRR